MKQIVKETPIIIKAHYGTNMRDINYEMDMSEIPCLVFLNVLEFESLRQLGGEIAFHFEQSSTLRAAAFCDHKL